MDTSIAVLIPTMNRPQSLKRTLAALMAGYTLPRHIVVVDQSKDSATRIENMSIVDKYKTTVKTTYYYQDTPSLTKARNHAMGLADEDILIFSDDDVDVKKDTITNVQRIMSDNQISMIAGLDELTPPSNSIIGYFMGTKSFRRRNTGHVTGAMLGRFPEHIFGTQKTEWAMGFFFAIRKSLAVKWGLEWDEKLISYAYAEDLDFSYSYFKKSREDGLMCVTNDSVVVQHLASKEYRIPSHKHIMMYIINRAYLLYKHNMSKTDELLMNWCNFCFLIQSKISGQNYQDYKDAIKRLKEVKSALKQGDLISDYYE